jgi:hypothetical protein
MAPSCPPSPLLPPSPPSLDLRRSMKRSPTGYWTGAAADLGDFPMGGGAATGRCGWGLFVGRLLGFGDARAGGEDSVQGHAASIRGASAAGQGRPWLASAMGPARLAPLPRVTVGRRETGRKG